MRADLNITKVIKDWEFNGERQWLVEANGKLATFIADHRPAVGNCIPCMMESRPGTDKKTGKAVTYWDARPIPDEQLNKERMMAADNVPNFATPSKQAEQPSSAEATGGRPPELPEYTLYRRIAHKSDVGVFMYEPVPQTQDPKPETPEWAKPVPKPTLAGDVLLINRYLDVLLNHPKINLQNEVNWLGGFASVIATGLRDYHDGNLVVETPLIPDDVVAAYQAAANGQWPQDERKLKP